jgi:hypothetical protein
MKAVALATVQPHDREQVLLLLRSGCRSGFIPRWIGRVCGGILNKRGVTTIIAA